jgi:hypothetical protein
LLLILQATDPVDFPFKAMADKDNGKFSNEKDDARDNRLGFMKKTSEERHLRDFQGDHSLS